MERIRLEGRLSRIHMGETTVLLLPAAAATRPLEAGPAPVEHAVDPVVDPDPPPACGVQPSEPEPPTFESFFEAQYPHLLRAMYLVTGNRYEAEEIAQETFVRACERWHLVLRADNRAGYVYRMAVNGYRSKLRRVARAARKVVRPTPEPDLFGAVDDRDAIGRALQNLSPGQREAVVLVEWLGMTDDEAGAMLGVSPVTIRVRIHRARAVLRPQLQREDQE
jgi:RNA polymerase sigma-70 factor (ECF subfamily)